MNKDKVINDLLKRISNLEFEIEQYEKSESYKYINGVAYFRQDYVLGREKEIERLHSIIKEVRDYIRTRQNTLCEIRISKILAILYKEIENGKSSNL